MADEIVTAGGSSSEEPASPPRRYNILDALAPVPVTEDESTGDAVTASDESALDPESSSDSDASTQPPGDDPAPVQVKAVTETPASPADALESPDPDEEIGKLSRAARGKLYSQMQAESERLRAENDRLKAEQSETQKKVSEFIGGSPEEFAQAEAEYRKASLIAADAGVRSAQGDVLSYDDQMAVTAAADTIRKFQQLQESRAMAVLIGKQSEQVVWERLNVDFASVPDVIPGLDAEAFIATRTSEHPLIDSHKLAAQVGEQRAAKQYLGKIAELEESVKTLQVKLAATSKSKIEQPGLSSSQFDGSVKEFDPKRSPMDNIRGGLVAAGKR